MERESGIERHARIGQTSEQLASRNALSRLIFYGVLGGIAGGIGGKLYWPAMAEAMLFCGVIVGLALAIAISVKIDRNIRLTKQKMDRIKRANQELEFQRKLKDAKASGAFDRWNDSK